MLRAVIMWRCCVLFDVRRVALFAVVVKCCCCCFMFVVCCLLLLCYVDVCLLFVVVWCLLVYVCLLSDVCCSLADAVGVFVGCGLLFAVRNFCVLLLVVV